MLGNFVEATLSRAMDLLFIPSLHPFNPFTFLLLSSQLSSYSLLFSLSFSILFIFHSKKPK
jgi:hypothetical protein